MLNFISFYIVSQEKTPGLWITHQFSNFVQSVLVLQILQYGRSSGKDSTLSIDHLLYEENAGAQLTMESSSND